ncbi:TnsD family Tn7-like transposition protein, partial [Rhizobium sp. 18055]
HYFADFANFQHQSRLLQTARSPLRWIEDLVERPDRSLHPICHLLMIDFLFGSIAEFSLAVDAERSSREATRGSAHTIPRGETKTSLQVPGLEIEHLLRNPSLSCRQIAQQTGKSVGTIVKYRRQRKIEVKERRKFVGAQTRTSIGHDLL